MSRGYVQQNPTSPFSWLPSQVSYRLRSPRQRIECLGTKGRCAEVGAEFLRLLEPNCSAAEILACPKISVCITGTQKLWHLNKGTNQI